MPIAHYHHYGGKHQKKTSPNNIHKHQQVSALRAITHKTDCRIISHRVAVRAIKHKPQWPHNPNTDSDPCANPAKKLLSPRLQNEEIVNTRQFKATEPQTLTITNCTKSSFTSDISTSSRDGKTINSTDATDRQPLNQTTPKGT